MTTISPTSAYSAYSSRTQTHAQANAAVIATIAGSSASTSSDSAATSVTLSDEALASMAERDFATVITDARSKLVKLLEEAGRSSPLAKDQLALDMSSIDHRELYAISSDDSFSADERAAAGLEMERRIAAALAGPAAIARVTGNYTGLYKAAAAYLDSLGPEERDTAEWRAGRDAITEGLKQLASAPGTLPDAGDSDPVALYLALTDAGQNAPEQSIESLAGNARRTLDQLYAQAVANGRAPTFNRNTTVGTFIDVSSFSSRSLSAIVLDGTGKFSAEETRAANMTLRERSGAALLSGFQAASKSSDPTAFSQNIIAAFSSMSAEERQAAGWSDALYKAAVDSYATTNKLMNMFSQVTGSQDSSFMSWLAPDRAKA